MGARRSSWRRSPFALAILIAAGLTVRSGNRLVTQPGGFDSERLLTFEIALPEREYREPDARRRFAADVTARFATIPGVEDAAVANVLPAAGWSPESPFVVEDQLTNDNAARNELLADPSRWPRVGYRIVSEDFFETMRVPIGVGRGFSRVDREDGQPVAIVSASFAKRFWPGRDAIGERLRLSEARPEWLTVVGVAADVTMYNWWDGIDLLAVYVPLRQAPPSGLLQAAVRTRGEPVAVTAALRAAVRDVDPVVPLDHVRTMNKAIADSTLGLGYVATLMAICGGIALFLAIIGLYGLMAYTIAQRTHEFGVRLALGATGSDVLRLTLRRAVTLTLTGLVLGMPIAWMVGRGMAGALRGVVSLDAMTFLVVASALAVVALVSAYLPARRALRLDPAAILRA